MSSELLCVSLSPSFASKGPVSRPFLRINSKITSLRAALNFTGSFKSAPDFTSSETTSQWSLMMAKLIGGKWLISGFLLLNAVLTRKPSGSAPPASNALTVLSFPSVAARCRGVRNSLSANTFGSAPASSNRRIRFGLLWAAATCRGCSPS